MRLPLMVLSLAAALSTVAGCKQPENEPTEANGAAGGGVASPIDTVDTIGLPTGAPGTFGSPTGVPGSPAGTPAGAQTSATSAETTDGGDSYITFYVVDPSEVPECNEARRHHLYYIASTSEFDACDGATWTLVNVSGPQGPAGVDGAAGAIGQAGADGEAGAMGQAGATGPAGKDAVTDENFISKFVAVGTVTSFACSGSYNAKTQTEYFTIASGGTGTPYKTCVAEACYTSVANGTRVYSSNTGTGCIRSISDYISCNSGYALVGGVCTGVCGISNLAACTTQMQCDTIGKHWWGGSCNAACESTKVATTRGCEAPIATCTPFQDIVDNQCAASSFNDLNGDICGSYSDNVLIKAGSHLVTCTSTFTGKVVVEAGTEFKIDNNWKLSFKHIYAKGTAGAHVTFVKSAGNPTGYWGGISISGGSVEYDTQNGWISGNLLEYVDVSGLSDQTGTELDFKNVAAKYLTVNSAIEMTLTGVHLNASTLSIKTLLGMYGQKSNVILGTTVSTTNGLTSLYDSYVAWTTFNQSVNLSFIYARSGFFFNTVTGGITCGDGTHVYGNKYTTTLTGACQQADNGTVALSTKNGVFIEEAATTTLSRNVPTTYHALVLDKNGWIIGATIAWKATFDIDGNFFDYATTWSGYAPEVSFESAESYQLKVLSVNADTTLTGKKSVSVNVQ